MASGQTDPQIPSGTFFALLVLGQHLVSSVAMLFPVSFVIHPSSGKLTRISP